MSKETIIFFAIAAIVVIVVGFLGNKIVDAITNKLSSKAAERQRNKKEEPKQENLADRFNKGKKL